MSGASVVGVPPIMGVLLPEKGALRPCSGGSGPESGGPTKSPQRQGCEDQLGGEWRQ